MYHFDSFAYIEESLHSWNKPNLIMVWAFWCVLEFCLLKFCCGFLHLCLSVILPCNFLFSVISLSGFGIRVMVASYNEVGSVYPSAIFWNCLRRLGVSSSLNVWQNSPVKPFGSVLLFPGRFLISFNSITCDCLCLCVPCCVESLWPHGLYPTGSSVHGIFQARILEQAAISSSRWSSWPRDGIRVSCVSWIGRGTLYH